MTVFSPSSHSLITVESHNVNIYPMIFLSNITYSNSDTLVRNLAYFVCSSSDQIASDIMY